VDPVVTSGGTVNVSVSATLRAKAFISGWTPSDTLSANYLLNLAAAATPTLVPTPGTYAAAQTVTLSSATAGALIRYTLDGADPTPWSPVFAGPFAIAGTTTVKAIAYAPDRAPSGVASGTYQINLGAVETPTLSVPSGSYVTSRTVTVSCATTGATIRYTTNGSDPTVSDPTIASGGTLLVDRAMIVKAAAWKTGIPQSAVARRDYVVTGMVAAGGNSTLGLKSDGTLWAWGANPWGQLGDGTTTFRPSPVQVTGLSSVITVAAGQNHSLAVKSDGTVWAWGYNGYGQLGDGTTTQRSAPVQVTGLSSVITVAAGQNHSLALKSDGSLWAWGSNGFGQLGDGTTTQRTAPVQITGVTGVAAIAAGQDHSLAAKSDSSVWAWGYNYYGQVGDGTNTQRLLPVSLSNFSGVSRVAAGVSFSVALRTNGQSPGTIWSWGLNAVGQLGDGSILNKNVPGEAAPGVVALAAGERHVVAPSIDGRTVAWGANDVSQLGNAGSAARSFGLPASGVTEILQAAAGISHTVGLRADGSVSGWGGNGSGQLGIGSQTNQTIAVSIPSFSLASNSWMTQDPDQDGLTNAAEYRLGSDPLNPDTNQDGLKDGVDVAMGKSATGPDVDGDGLLNGKELQIGTNPLVADTDGDGVLDGADCAPLDPTRWQCTTNPSDTTPPVITLAEPPNAVLLP
jgi:alpha-tubulin suppressor-like RCC1 family protein